MCALLIQIGTNLANDYFDYEKGADRSGRLGPTRVTQAGLVTPTQMKRAVILVFGLAVAVGVFLVLRGGWPVIIIGLLSILFGVLYTAGPLPLGYHGLGELFVFIFFGPVAVGGTYYVQAMDINSIVLWAGVPPGLFSVAILTVNNLRDIDSDRRVGKKTLAVRFGRTYARIQYVGAIVIGSLLPLTFYVGTGDHIFAGATALVALAAMPAIKSVFCRPIGVHLNETLAMTGKLLLLYSFLFSVGWLL